VVDLDTPCSPIFEQAAINTASSFVETVPTQAQCSTSNLGIQVHDTPMHDPLIGKYFLFTNYIHCSHLRILLWRLT